MDPYWRGRLKEVQEGNDYVIDQPLFMNLSTYFAKSPFHHGYNIKEVQKKFYEDTCKHNGKKNYNVELKNSGHLTALDAAIQNPYSLSTLQMIGTPGD